MNTPSTSGTRNREGRSLTICHDDRDGCCVSARSAGPGWRPAASAEPSPRSPRGPRRNLFDPWASTGSARTSTPPGPRPSSRAPPRACTSSAPCSWARWGSPRPIAGHARREQEVWSRRFVALTAPRPCAVSCARLGGSRDRTKGLDGVAPLRETFGPDPECGTPSRSRTYDLRLRKPKCYPRDVRENRRVVWVVYRGVYLIDAGVPIDYTPDCRHEAQPQARSWGSQGGSLGAAPVEVGPSRPSAWELAQCRFHP